MRIAVMETPLRQEADVYIVCYNDTLTMSSNSILTENKNNTFNLKGFTPAGDQPKAIKELVVGLKKNMRRQTLLGATGTGKTFTIANVIQQIQKPTLVIAHNKTLAAQLAQEFRTFFPDAAVHYFVSYYDYYQPEAYMPVTDTYIEKDAQINEEIDRLRHASTQALLTRPDTIIVASVSCIYGLGSPKDYERENIRLSVGDSATKIAHRNARTIPSIVRLYNYLTSRVLFRITNWLLIPSTSAPCSLYEPCISTYVEYSVIGSSWP